MLESTPQARRAYAVYLLLECTFALFFALYATVSAIYRLKVAGLNPLQLVLVGTVLEGTAFLCEVPTGVVADVFSRRLSVIIGVIVVGAGFALEGLVPRFGVILLAQVVWGAGYTFISGAQQAWIAGEVGEQRVSAAFLRGSQLGQAGAFAGIVGSIALASIRLSLPLVCGGLLMALLGVALIFLMPEHGFTPTPRTERSSWLQMRDTLRAGNRLVWRRPVLLTMLGIAAIAGMSSEGFDRLWEAHFLTSFRFPALGHLAPVVWFGIIDAAAMLLSIAATEVIRRRFDTAHHGVAVRTLFAVNVVLVVSTIAFGLAGGFALAVACYLVTATVRRTREPIFYAWVTQHADPKVRATVLSLVSQSDELGQIAGGPVIGLLGTVRGLRAAIVATGAVLAPALLLFTRAASQPGAPVTEPAVEAVAIEP